MQDYICCRTHGKLITPKQDAFGKLGVVSETKAPQAPAILNIKDVSSGSEESESAQEKDKIESLATKVDEEQKKLESQKMEESDLRKMLTTRRQTEEQYREEWKNQRISRADYAATLREIKEEKKMIKLQLKELSK